MDERVRGWLAPAIDRLAVAADRAGVTPHRLTALGLVLALGAAVAAAFGAWVVALVLWLLSRVPDGVDGALARLRGDASELGGFLDLMADFTAYGGFVVGCAVGAPDARLACVVLLLAYYLNGAAFLAISSLAERRAQRVVDDGRSLQFVGGLTEGTETIVAHALLAVVGAVRVEHLDVVAWVFAAAVFVTVLQRIAFGVRVLRD